MILLDLGNTRLKCAIAPSTPGDDAPTVHAFAHASADFLRDVERWLIAHRDLDRRAWLAAVAPDAVIDPLIALLKRCGITVQRATVSAEALGLRVAYADPSRLGVDRWLGMLATWTPGDGAVLVASVGSALTVDAVDTSGQHLGGLIAPPPEAMRAALLARTPRLDVPDGEVHRFARSTPDAIESGCLLAGAALIERSLQELARTSDAPRLVVTGGGAEALRPWLPAHVHSPDLVLRGLARWAAQATH